MMSDPFSRPRVIFRMELPQPPRAAAAPAISPTPLPLISPSNRKVSAAPKKANHHVPLLPCSTRYLSGQWLKNVHSLLMPHSKVATAKLA